MADAAPDKVSFKSPYYDSLDADVSRRLELPPGLLTAVRTRGERSNADQESEAGAKTVYQIIPATRESALKKWGIDPYLNETNAAEVAGRLLKDSLDRNQGAVPLAVAEYVGGTDPKAWGPTTRAYVQRVTGQSLNPREPSMAKVIAAYKSGAMDPADKAEFEADVAAGKVILPKNSGINIKAPAVAEPSPDAAVAAPQGVLDAYAGGKMTPDERSEFEADVAAGRVTVPAGFAIEKPPGIVSRVAGAIADTVLPSAQLAELAQAPGEVALAMGTGTAATVAGAAKGLAYGLTNDLGTPEGAAAAAAEAKRVAEAGTFQPRTGAGKALASGLGAALEASKLQGLNPAEVVMRAPNAVQAAKPAVAQAVQAVESRIPSAAVRAAGGEPGAIDAAARAAAAEAPPGVVPAAELPTPGAPQPVTPPPAVTEVLAQAKPIAYDDARALVKGKTEKPGGTDPVQQLAAAEGNGKKLLIVDAPVSAFRANEEGARYDGTVNAERALDYASRPAENVPPVIATLNKAGTELNIIDGGHRLTAARARGDATIPTIISIAEDRIPVARPAAAAPGPALQTAEELAATARKASAGGLGSGKAAAELAAQTAPDAATVKAMDDLGFHYQPDHVTTNQAYRELAQAVKSVPGSETRAAELEILAHNAQKADELITSLGGTRDLSIVSKNVRDKLDQIHADLKSQAKEIYDEIDAKIPRTTPAPAPDVLALIAKRAEALGGEAHLTAGEKKIIADLTPKEVTIKKPSVFAGQTDSVSEMREPTYALLDQTRKDIGAAKRGADSGAFGTRDGKILGDLEAALRKDQGRIAQAQGVGPLWEAANSATKAYKAIQERLVQLFGEKLEKSIVGNLNAAVGKLTQGDVSNFVKLISAIPDSMRREVVASGLSSAFGVNARNGTINFNSYAKWWEGLQRNTVARDALFSNLPPEAVKSLTNLYKASKGISSATKERITTGRIQAVSDELLRGDSLVGHVFNIAKRAGAMEAATSLFGLPGVGLAAGIGAALAKGRTPAMKAADALINSPEFIAAARHASRHNVQRLARSKQFGAFARASGSKLTNLKDRERWIAEALAAKQGVKK